LLRDRCSQIKSNGYESQWSQSFRSFDLEMVGRCAVYPSVSVAQGEGGGGDNTSRTHDPSCEEGERGGGDNASRARYTLSVDLRCAKWATEDRRRVIFTIHRLTAHRNFGS